MIVALILIAVLALVVLGVWLYFRVERRRAALVQEYMERAIRHYEVIQEGAMYRYEVLEEPPVEPRDRERWN